MLNIRLKDSLRAVTVLMVATAVVLFISTSDALAEAPPAKSSGILPLPDYSGDFSKRSYLLGDLGGKRTEWANKGFTFDVGYNQYFQSVTNGGIDTDSEYGGTIDYNINLDFDRMGLIPGGLLQMRAVSRYGDSVNGTGSTSSRLPSRTPSKIWARPRVSVSTPRRFRQCWLRPARRPASDSSPGRSVPTRRFSSA